MADSFAIRPMVPGDLPAVGALTNAAFGALHEAPAGAPDDPMFPALFFQARLAADPPGCFVATSGRDDQGLAGALISVARGSLGWFGPLAVHPNAQRRGLAAALVARCLQSWRERGLQLMGLETFGDSAFHVRFYGKFGFQPAWTGITYHKELHGEGPGVMPAGVQAGGKLPDLGFIYPGLDVSSEATATVSTGAGVVLTAADGAAIIHLQPTFADPGTGFIPFLAAASRPTFGMLIEAAEQLAAAEGHTALLARAPGSAFATTAALTEHGYLAGRVMVRMKAGDNLDYDRGPGYYLDNWL